MGILKLTVEEMLTKGKMKNDNFFWDGELKEQKLAENDKKLQEIEARKAGIKEEKAAKKAAKAAEKAAERALLEEEEQRQKNAAVDGIAMFEDIARKNNVALKDADEMGIPEDKTPKLISIVEKFKKGETSIVEKYIKSDVSALLDENLKSFQTAPTGQALLNRNLASSPLYIADGRDKLCVERIYKVDSNIEDIANLVVETKYCKFLLEFKVSIKF